MKLIGLVQLYQTGRRYTSQGQRILWAIIKRDDGSQCVAFSDFDRMIDGVIDLHFGNLDLVDERWVLRAYDDHHWHRAQHGEIEFLHGAYRRGNSEDK